MVIRSHTASLFHVVDQLSAWSPFTHRQYDAWRPVGAPPSALARHVAVRKRLGWGQGLEHALYVAEPDHHRALDAAVASGLLDPATAAEEGGVLDALAPFLDERIASGEGRAQAFVSQLRHETPAFARLAGAWLTLADYSTPPPVQLVLVPSPGAGNGGGGANGPGMVVELTEGGDANASLSTVAHELIHVLMKPRLRDMVTAAGRCGAELDAEVIGESLAYASATGLFATGPTLEQVKAASRAGTPFRNYSEVALVIRPLLQGKLANPAPGDFDTVMDAICSAWKARYIPPPEDTEIRTATVVGVCWDGMPCVPSWIAGKVRSELMLFIKEWPPQAPDRPLRAFSGRAGKTFLLKAKGHPDVHLSLEGLTFSDGHGTMQGFALKVAEADRASLVSNVAYTLVPVNTSTVYRWVVPPELVVKKP